MSSNKLRGSVLCILMLSAAMLTRANAQNNPCVDPGSQIIGQFKGEAQLSASGKSTTSIWDVIVTRTVSGNIALSVDSRSIRFSGDNEGIDNTSTLALFDLIDMVSISQAINREFIPCPVPCDQPLLVTIASQACVQRAGSGISTSFMQTCGDACCTRTYSVCCPSGTASPTLTLIRVDNPGCAAGSCQSTCP